MILTVLTLASCAGYSVILKNDGEDNLTDEENGIDYVYCLGYLRAADIYAKPYAKVTGPNKKQKMKLYEIPGLDPKKWLSEDINSVAVPFLFRATDEKEPALGEFASKIHVAFTDELSVVIDTIKDEAVIAAIINDFLNGRPMPMEHFPAFAAENFTFFFESEKYPGIYYVLEYFMDGDGNCYLFDRWSPRLTPCGVNLFELEI